MNWRDRLAFIGVTGLIQFDKPLEKLRSQMRFSNFVALKPFDVRVQPERIGNVPVEWYYPKTQSRAQTCMVYLHGGAYVAGSISTHRAMLMHWAKIMQVAICSVEYRLAPEHRFPAGLDDAMTVYQTLHARGFKASDMVIGGDSAGGGLALATLLRLRDEGVELPAGACLIAPWTNLAESEENGLRRMKERKEGWLTPNLRIYGIEYAGTESLSHPYVSPQFGEMHGLPPLCIHIGENEFLFEDAQRVTDKARAAGVPVEFKEWQDMWHVFHALTPISPTATQALREFSEFSRRVLKIQN